MRNGRMRADRPGGNTFCHGAAQAPVTRSAPLISGAAPQLAGYSRGNAHNTLGRWRCWHAT